MFDEQPDSDPHGECAAEIKRLTRDGRALRRMLCAALYGGTAYMDDGEASDCSVRPFIDFIRDSPESIQEKIIRRRRLRALDRPCSTHPDAPHGFNRNASHSEDRHVCDCEGWVPEDIPGKKAKC